MSKTQDDNLSQYPPHIQDHFIRYPKSPNAIENTNNSEAHSEPTSSTSSRFNFDFLKLGSSSRTKDGEKPKRRGPKADAKPALTRRQELNRQAQRTHRERKERYVKTLEEEVVRLREAFTVVTKEKTTILEENRRLKELLEAHGISPNLNSPTYPIGRFHPAPETVRQAVVPERNAPYDYNEIGIDFVLTLEKPCMDHIQFLAENSIKPDADIHGHAMMTIFPPESHLINHPNVPWGHRTYDLNSNELATLFNLSNRLQLDGELTPITVWVLITRHARFAELNIDDFKVLKEELVQKVKCHGFGAVVEEFEVEDCLTYMFSKKYGYALG